MDLLKSEQFILGSKIILFIIIFSSLLIYFKDSISGNDQSGPCSPDGYPRSCYNIVELACNEIWEPTKDTCQLWVQQLNLPAGRLAGPIIKKCRLAIFDRAFRYSNKSTPRCESLRTELDEWIKRNDFQDAP